MSELIFLVEDDPEGGYIARALGESIFTTGDDMTCLEANIREAVECHFDEGDAPFTIHVIKNKIVTNGFLLSQE